jgi:putative ABC transport system permease protein
MTLQDLRLRLAALFTPRTTEQNLQDEIAFHLAMARDKHRRQGRSDADAERLARARFGSTASVADQCRDARGTAWVDATVQDLRYAMRSFLRAPRFTVPAVLALALGIGSTDAMFSVVRGVLLKPLPYRDAERIVVVWENNVPRHRPRNVIAPSNFVAWLERNQSFEFLGMAGPTRLTLSHDGQPEELSGMTISSAALMALGMPPSLGRLYTSEEDRKGRDKVVLVSHDFWHRRLAARADAVGENLTIDGEPRTIVGVMPPDFSVVGERPDLMVPYGLSLEDLRGAPGRGVSFAVGRLAAHVSVEQAAGDLQRIAAARATENPRLNTGWSVTLVPVYDQIVEPVRPALTLMVGAALLVLLVACVNVANLLLARGAVREQEIGVRTALGARRGRLVRQLLTESLLLSTLGGLAGVVLAFALHRGVLLVASRYMQVPRIEEVALDAPVILFALALSLTTGIVFGIAPALFASSGAADAAREGSRQVGGARAGRALRALMVAEIAIALVLLSADGLLIRSFARLQNINPGFRPDGVLTARISLPQARYPDERQSARFLTELIGQVANVPGVASAAGITFLPLSGPGIGTSFHRTDRAQPPSGQEPSTDVRPVTPGFFRTMGIPLTQGRDVAESDTSDSPLVAVISAAVAREQFEGEDPIGKRLLVSLGPPGGMEVAIVGVVGDIKMSSLAADTRQAIYIPHTQLALGMMTVVARSSGTPESLVGGIAATVRSLDPELPLADVRTMREVVDATLARPRAVSLLLTVLAAMALALAGVGIYGVMAYSVSRRTREFGVRMALGATTASVFRLVLGQSARVVAVGLVIGLIAAAGLTRLLEGLLFQTPPVEPITFGITALVLFCVSMAAALVPARRGTRVAPIEALRSE